MIITEIYKRRTTLAEFRARIKIWPTELRFLISKVYLQFVRVIQGLDIK